MPSVVIRRNIASIRWGGSLAPPSSHQVIQPIDRLAGDAARASIFGADLHQAQILMVVASSAAVVALLVLTTLSMYKPRGMTPYGTRKQSE